MTNELNPTERLILANATSGMDRFIREQDPTILVDTLHSIGDHLILEREARAIARIGGSSRV